MTLSVQKFGGTSIGDAAKIRAVAGRIAETVHAGTQVVVAVSAVGDETDELLDLAPKVSSVRPGRELDMLITAGERKAAALLCLALHDLGIQADSFTGSQAGIVTNGTHTAAKIAEVHPDRIRATLEARRLPVVGGAQGISASGDVTFLGRGGTDTTAVALAWALGADRCEIYTDVAGVYRADPRLAPGARVLRHVSLAEMLAMCSAGCPKPAKTAIEFACAHGVALHVRSASERAAGTWIDERGDENGPAIIGVVATRVRDVGADKAGLPLAHATPLPYDSALDGQAPDFAWLDRLLEDAGSGLDAPAAAIVECVQGEGGINVARPEWLRGLAERCRRHDIVLIVDDVQMGCGRTGPFFSFEAAEIAPDIVCLSKSIGGYGLPLALTLIRPDLDVWEPGEHSGTFRGVDPALITGAAALRTYWQDDALQRRSAERGERIAAALIDLGASITSTGVEVRGRGMVHGLAFERAEMGEAVSAAAFERGLLVETAGPQDEVVKLLPPLTIEDDELDQGLEWLADAVHAAC